nr:MAG TPA: hypothetical protein [Caudoviricetes sp.]
MLACLSYERCLYHNRHLLHRRVVDTTFSRALFSCCKYKHSIYNLQLLGFKNTFGGLKSCIK